MSCSTQAHKQIPSFTMSISITHACSAAKLVSEAGQAYPGLFIMEGCLDGGDRRDRTDDLKLAKLPLSQLSYVPS
jgi:hypothetical protein